MTIECPWCHTNYPIERTCLIGKPNQAFTITCESCQKSFDGHFEEHPGTPASRLFRWTRGWFGQPEIPYSVDAATRKRIE